MSSFSLSLSVRRVCLGAVLETDEHTMSAPCPGRDAWKQETYGFSPGRPVGSGRRTGRSCCQTCQFACVQRSVLRRVFVAAERQRREDDEKIGGEK
jgi:hypothetical protein